MKKIAILSFIISSMLTFGGVFASDFSKAIKTCASFSDSKDITISGKITNLAISLNKKGNKCIYKEKITQSIYTHLLTCTFEEKNLQQLSILMEEYYQQNKAALDKNKIFQAKMSSNSELFEHFLANPKYCNITNLNSTK